MSYFPAFTIGYLEFFVIPKPTDLHPDSPFFQLFSPLRSMEKASQIDVTMPNVPNSLARVGDKLRSVGVNISAITCTEGPTNSTIHLIVDDPVTAKAALDEFGEIEMVDVLLFKMKNKPGAIGQIGRALGAADVNIRNMYATTWGKDATVYVSVDDAEEAMANVESWKNDGGEI